MGIDVPADNGVVVEKRIERRAECWRTRRLRRNVSVRHDDFFAADEDLDDDDFRIVVEGRSDFGVRDGVVDKRDEATATSRRPIASDNCIVYKLRCLSQLIQFSLLHAGDFHTS